MVLRLQFEKFHWKYFLLLLKYIYKYIIEKFLGL